MNIYSYKLLVCVDNVVMARFYVVTLILFYFILVGDYAKHSTPYMRLGPFVSTVYENSGKSRSPLQDTGVPQ